MNIQKNNGVFPVLPLEELEKIQSDDIFNLPLSSASNNETKSSDTEIDFSQYLVEKRKELGLKQWEMAKIVNLSLDMYKAYENGRRTPKPPRMQKMKDALENCEACNHNPNLKDLIEYIREVKKGSFTFIFTDEKSMQIANTVFDFIIKNIRLYYKL